MKVRANSAMEEAFNPASLEPGVTTETDRTIVELFKRLIVDKELTPSYIAEQINSLFLSSLLACGDTKEDELVSTFLWNLWVLLIQIVQECPVSQLEAVIEVLRELRGTSSRVVNQWGVSIVLQRLVVNPLMSFLVRSPCLGGSPLFGILFAG